MSARRRAAAALALAAALLALAAGCGRRTRLVYRGDSLGTAPLDSAAIVLRAAQQAWDAGGGEPAARASAHALQLRLGSQPSDAWPGIAESFLDSLGVGGEVAGASCAMAVNFFSRSDPSSGSWPWLYWCGPKGPQAQPIEGRSMKLDRMASRGIRPGGARDTVPAEVALLLERRASLGAEPYLLVWTSRGGGAWAVTQTLGPDSLGGAGTGEFESRGDSTLLTTRTYRASRGFDECATCPHVFRVRHFAWARDGFHKLDETETPSPYSTFVHFVQALVADDRATCGALVTDPALADAARRAGLATAKGLWRVAPASDETATHMVFQRGTDEAYDVQFVQRGAAWLIDGITVTRPTSE